MTMNQETQALTPYEALGGAPAISELVARFYGLMDELPEAYAVRQMHPESLKGSAESLCEYLSGWLGGPPLYTAKKGHPRLRMRHLPYAVSPTMRDQWMLCMTLALHEQVVDEALRDGLIQAFAQMADHMVNTGDRTGCGQGRAAAGATDGTDTTAAPAGLP
ncbi:MAG: group II truncated hemoglobin [Burkholderiaceae bacterium]